MIRMQCPECSPEKQMEGSPVFLSEVTMNPHSESSQLPVL